jgi:hypothetical protein
MTAPANAETEQRTYDSDFLKLLANPPSPAVRPFTPGCRTVAVNLYTRGQLAILRRLFSKLAILRHLFSKRKIGRYEVTLDLSRQVLRLEVPDDFVTPLYPSFAELGLDASTFAPAAALALKAKQFDDGLYACVELASDAGLADFPAKKELLVRLLHSLAADTECTAAAILTAATRLGGQEPQVSAEVTREADKLEQEFLADELRCKPLGFYTWSEELTRIFQRDRMLQTEIREQAARPLAMALSRDEGLLSAYSTALTLTEKLTNPLVSSDLRKAARAVKEGRIATLPESMCLFPPSRAHETDLIMKLYAARPIPEGFNLADEMIKRIRSGSLDLKPTPASGWYDYQTYALEALVAADRMPEGTHLGLKRSYQKELDGLVKALLALTRETHVKQLPLPMPGASPPRFTPEVDLYISPGLTLEPLATYYLRRARSYRFVREVVEKAFGLGGLESMRRLTEVGLVNLSLGAELRLMEALFHGAYLQSCAEIGMTPEEDPDLGTPTGPNASRALLGTWLASLRRDPDLGRDIRMMVPIFYDIGRRKTKVWVVLGVATKPLHVSYATPPKVKEIKGSDGMCVDPRKVAVKFGGDSHQIAYFATAEVYVTRVLDRTEFRQHCDRHKTYGEIVSNLS